MEKDVLFEEFDKPINIKPKKIKLSSEEKKLIKKCELIKSKLGNLKGAFNIWSKSSRFYLVIRYEEKGSKKEKYKSIFSYKELPFIEKICERLAQEMQFPYNLVPFDKNNSAKIKKQKEDNNFEIDKTLFREYEGIFFIKLTFGIIILEDTKFEVKRNSDCINKQKIVDLKSNMNYNKCLEILSSSYYKDSEVINTLIKEVYRLGDSDNANSLRRALGQDAKVSYVDDNGKFKYRNYLEKDENIESDTNI